MQNSYLEVYLISGSAVFVALYAIVLQISWVRYRKFANPFFGWLAVVQGIQIFRAIDAIVLLRAGPWSNQIVKSYLEFRPYLGIGLRIAPLVFLLIALLTYNEQFTSANKTDS